MKVNIALLTVTDTRTFDNDKSGSILVTKIEEANHNLFDRKICKDNKDEIVLILKQWLKNEKIDVIITTGGTGLTGRDITPEALEEIADKHIPGFGEVFRTLSLKTVGTSAIQSRACAVLSNGKYIFVIDNRKVYGNKKETTWDIYIIDKEKTFPDVTDSELAKLGNNLSGLENKIYKFNQSYVINKSVHYQILTMRQKQ